MVCHTHFEAYAHAKADGRTWAEIDEEVKSCEDCKAARQKRIDDMQQNQTIDPAQPYGQHIGLVCRVCGTMGTTKNISFIGARTVFVPCDHGAADMEVAT